MDSGNSERKTMPAKTIDSYRDTLYAVIDVLAPMTDVLSFKEYGPGLSTMMMIDDPRVKQIVSIEHDNYWFEKLKGQIVIPNVEYGGRIIPKAVIILEPDLEKYPYAYPSGRMGDGVYTAFFVDGRNRVKCLEYAKKCGPYYTILHDADRADYFPGINLFKFNKFTDEGNTVVLTDNETMYEKIKDLNL